MNFARRLMAFFGLSKDARVNVRTDDIDVTIVGKPEQVQAVLEAVRSSLEIILRARNAPRFEGGKEFGVSTESLIVLPTELDEKDSPYAIPEHRTVERSDPLVPDESENLEEDTTGSEQPFTDTDPAGEGITNPGD